MHWITLAQSLAVPVLGLAGRLVTRPGSKQRSRRLQEHCELRDSVPENLRDPLDNLIEAEIQSLCDAEKRRIARKIDGATVAALIFVSLVGAAALTGGFALSHWWSITLGVVIAIAAILLIAAGSPQIYQYPEDEKHEDPGSEKAVPAPLPD